MSRAFVKEDIDPVERIPRARSPSGLPAGSVNYMTPEGAEELRLRLERLSVAEQQDELELSRLQEALASATIVQTHRKPGVAVFGSTVTIQKQDDSLTAYRIVGADEADLHEGWVSWVSPLGRALLAAQVGQRISLSDSVGDIGIVIAIE